MTSSSVSPEQQPPVPNPEECWRVMVLINDWIKHADAKIAGILATAGVAAGVLYSVLQDIESPPMVVTVCGAATSVALIFGIFFAGLALRPRLWTTSPATSKIYFEHISRAYPKDRNGSGVNAFVSRLVELASDRGSMAAEVSAQVWALAHIAAAKYRWTNLSMVFVALAIVSLGLTAIMAICS